LGLAAAWFLVHVAIYIVGMCGLDAVLYKHLEHAMKHFFGWQALGFLVAAVVVDRHRPSAAATVLGGYLAASSLVLLAFSQDAALVGRFSLLLLWTACAVEGMRLLIGRGAGLRYATYGVAMAAVYAALVPIGFVFGVLHAIRPTNVAALAVATALPGAAAWLHRGGRALRWAAADHRFAAVPAAACATTGPTCRRPLNDAAANARNGSWTIFGLCMIEVIWTVLAIEFIGASTTEVRSDAVRVHLPYMLQVVADHGLSHQYACWYRLQPMAVQAYGAMLTTIGTVAAAKWFSWLALAALVLVVVEEVRRRGGSRNLGLFAGAAVVCCPLLAGLAGSLYIDHVLVLLCTAGFIVLFRALEVPCLRGVLLSAAVIGAMAQVKYNGLVFAAVWWTFLAVGLLWRRGWRVAAPWSIAAGALVVAVALPWHVYVYLGTGNPLYPYLDRWFPSPYWTAGFTPRQMFEAAFKLDGGLAGAAAFPWTATYRTTRFIEGYDGLLGFWAIALVPCLVLACIRSFNPEPTATAFAESTASGDAASDTNPRRRRWLRVERGTWTTGTVPWDMAIAAAAMIAGVVVYTPYVRYWLPAYPLLVAACALAAGSLVRSLTDRPPARWLPLCSGVAVALLLYVPLPLVCVNMAWDEYAQRTPKKKRLEQWFPGYQVARRLNAILGPDDGVLCSGFCGVHLVGGRPYAYAMWFNRIHHIHDRATFADFCRRNRIRYWLVNLDGPGFGRHIYGGDDIAAEYWTDRRRVMASGSTAVYDVGPLSRSTVLQAAGGAGGVR
jgi:hypothetical protein